MAKNGTLERREDYYPNPYLKGLIRAYAEDMDMPRAQVSVLAAKTFFDSLPKDQLQRLQNKAKLDY